MTNPTTHPPIHFILLSLISCTKPELAPSASTPINTVATTSLTITGHYHHPSCTTFFDARLTPAGELIHDDTTDPQACDEPTNALTLEPFRFPIPDQTDLYGLRITLHQHLLLHPHHFSVEDFHLSTPAFPNLEAQAVYRFAFAVPGKQILQIFFPETTWRQLLSSADKLDFSFQLLPGKNTPSFTLLQGRFDPNLDLVNLPDLPDLLQPDLHPPELHFHLLDSLHTLRIRSIYHLLPEDFAIWSENKDCHSLQNWDLTLIPATGYNLLEIKLDPPFLDCLLQEKTVNFRIALLK